MQQNPLLCSFVFAASKPRLYVPTAFACFHAQPPRPSPRQAGSCLALKQPLIPICKLRATKQRLEAATADAVSDFFTDQEIPQSGQDAINAWVKKQLAKTAVGAALKKIQFWLTPLDVMCLVYPIRLDRFTISPKFIPNARYESQATAVKISAFLKPETSAKDMARYLEKKEAEAIANDIDTTGFLEPIGGGTRAPHYGGARIAIQFRNPENPDGTQRIRMSGSVEGNPSCFLAIGLTAEGGRSAGGNNILGSASYSLDAPAATMGQISVSLESGVRAENESVVCKMKGAVELVRK